MPADFDSTQVCPGCGGPIAVPEHRPADAPAAVRHIGVPGEPADCPK